MWVVGAGTPWIRNLDLSESAGVEEAVQPSSRRAAATLGEYCSVAEAQWLGRVRRTMVPPFVRRAKHKTTSVVATALLAA